MAKAYVIKYVEFKEFGDVRASVQSSCRSYVRINVSGLFNDLLEINVRFLSFLGSFSRTLLLSVGVLLTHNPPF